MNPKLTAQHRKIIVLATLLGGAIVAFSLRGRIDISDVQRWMENAGSIGWIMFILIYALATILLLPGSLITIAGGVVYGPLLGTLLSLMGATLGASGAFILARYSSLSWVEQRMGEKMRQLIKGIDKEGWRFVAWVRLVPLFPFVLVNYALGLTRIPLLSYTITSFIFMLPGTTVYTLIGHAGGTALSEQAVAEQMRWLLIALAAFATLLFIPSLLRHWRKPS
jgi:uncharacterized membrane protein YdjX (TVP38/TMEM64 family)